MRILKKIISEVLILLIILCNVQGVVVYANDNINEGINTEIKDETLDLTSYGLNLEEKPEAINLESMGIVAGIKALDIDISSLKIDKTEVKLGESINIGLKASDDISGIKYIWVYYKTPITGKSNWVELRYNSTTDRYEGSMYIDDSMESGLWKINWIYGKDNSDNEVDIYNSNINNYATIRKDLSTGDFNVVELNEDNSIKPIEGATVITKNEIWSNKTVNGDLYIGSEAVLTVNSNVTVTGNVYVLGALKIYGGLTIKETLYGTSMSWGGESNTI